MAYEYPSERGTVHLVQIRGLWQLQFAGRRTGRWRSPDQAARAVARQCAGPADWDHQRVHVPEDLLDWRPIGDSL